MASAQQLKLADFGKRTVAELQALCTTYGLKIKVRACPSRVELGICSLSLRSSKWLRFPAVPLDVSLATSSTLQCLPRQTQCALPGFTGPLCLPMLRPACTERLIGKGAQLCVLQIRTKLAQHRGGSQAGNRIRRSRGSATARLSHSQQLDCGCLSRLCACRAGRQSLWSACLSTFR